MELKLTEDEELEFRDFKAKRNEFVKQNKVLLKHETEIDITMLFLMKIGEI